MKRVAIKRASMSPVFTADLLNSHYVGYVISNRQLSDKLVMSTDNLAFVTLQVNKCKK